LDGTSSFDASDGKPGGICKAAYHPRLPLQGTLDGLVELGRLPKVDDVDISVGRTHDEQVIPHIHRVDSLLALYRGSWSALPEIPILQSLVPRSRHYHGRAHRLEVSDASYGSLVLRYLHSLACRQVADFGLFIRSARDYLLTVLQGPCQLQQFKMTRAHSY
jgi:hypothetical protein